jgi:hypothetical protein
MTPKKTCTKFETDLQNQFFMYFFGSVYFGKETETEKTRLDLNKSSGSFNLWFEKGVSAFVEEPGLEVNFGHAGILELMINLRKDKRLSMYLEIEFERLNRISYDDKHKNQFPPAQDLGMYGKMTIADYDQMMGYTDTDGLY